MLRRSLWLMKTIQTRNEANRYIIKALSTETLVVEHDDVKHVFYIKLSNDVAFVHYDKFNSVLDYNETQVPPAFQGKGIAQILAKAAFDYVVKNDLKMKLSCTYLQKYLEDHALPEYTSRIVK